MALAGCLHLLKLLHDIVCSQTFEPDDQNFVIFGVDCENGNNHNHLYQRITCPQRHILILVIQEQSSIQDRMSSRGRLKQHCSGGQHGGALIDHIHIAASTCKALMSPAVRKPLYPSKCYLSEKVTLQGKLFLLV